MSDAVQADPVAITKVLTLINEARQGLRPLRVSERLGQAAQEHAADMAKRNYFNYTPPEALGGEGVEARVRRLGYNGRTGFNLGRNRASADEAVASWLEDATTRAGIVDPDHREIGVGEKDGYWTLLLGTPDQLISDPLREEMAALINGLRKKYNIAPLTLQRQLNYIAQTHAADMSKRLFFEHVNPDGKDVAQRAQDVDYHSRVYELLGEGEMPIEVFETWADNAAFRSQLTSDTNVFIGVGMFAAKWTVVLGLPIADKNPPQKSPAELRSELGKLIADQRATAKLPALRENPLLQQVVEGHVGDMVQKGFLSYEYPGAPGIPGRVKESGYKGRIFPAITKGQGSPDAVLKLFLDSEGHKKNLLDADFRDFAITVRDGYWVLLFGAPQVEASVDMRTDALRILNAERAAVNVPALSLSSLLNAVAQDYAQDMARRNFFGFTNPEGKGPDALAKTDGFPGQVLPSLVRGASSAEGALSAWLKGPQSRASLLSAQYTLLGIGVADARWILLLGTAGPGTASA